MPRKGDKQSKRPKQDRAKETRNNILSVSAHLFGSQGIPNTSTNLIASEAGVSIGTLYRYFGNRDEIVTELNEALFQEVEDNYAELFPQAAEMVPRDAVALMLHTAVRTLLSNADLVRALVADLQFYGSGIPEFEPRLRFLIKLYLLHLLEPGTTADVDTIAFILLNAGFSTALRSVELEAEGLDRDVVIEGTADMIGAWVAKIAEEDATGRRHDAGGDTSTVTP